MCGVDGDERGEAGAEEAHGQGVEVLGERSVEGGDVGVEVAAFGELPGDVDFAAEVDDGVEGAVPGPEDEVDQGEEEEGGAYGFAPGGRWRSRRNPGRSIGERFDETSGS